MYQESIKIYDKALLDNQLKSHAGFLSLRKIVNFPITDLFFSWELRWLYHQPDTANSLPGPPVEKHQTATQERRVKFLNKTYLVTQNVSLLLYLLHSKDRRTDGRTTVRAVLWLRQSRQLPRAPHERGHHRGQIDN